MIINNLEGIMEILFKSNAFEKNSNLLIQNYKKELNLYRQLYEKLIKITDKKDLEEIKILISIQSKDKKNENYMKKIKKILNNT